VFGVVRGKEKRFHHQIPAYHKPTTRKQIKRVAIQQEPDTME